MDLMGTMWQDMAFEGKDDDPSPCKTRENV